MRRRVVIAIVPLILGMVLLTSHVTSARAVDPLRSFYVVRYFFSDDLSAWNDTVLDVSPLGDDVRVRLIRVELAHPACSALLVRAVERVVPKTTVARVAGTDICENTEKSVEAAVEAAHKTDVHRETARQVIAARCGDEERVLGLPYDVDVDQRMMKRSAPRVAQLEEMIYRVRARVFGKAFWFRAEAEAQEREMETLGASLVPELTSGKFNAAYGDAERLRGYRIVPPDERGPKPELLDAASLHLTTYVAPEYPHIAQAARVSGDVQLRLNVDPQTGAVGNAEAVKDVPLLSRAAIVVARNYWRFAPEYLTGQPIVVTVRFTLDC